MNGANLEDKAPASDHNSDTINDLINEDNHTDDVAKKNCKTKEIDQSGWEDTTGWQMKDGKLVYKDDSQAS